MEPSEIIETDKAVVRCDGGGGALGHPVVYLNMGDRPRIDCPYCGRRFVLAGGRPPKVNEPAQITTKQREERRR